MTRRYLAIINLSDKIYSAIDSEEVVAGIFIDLSKALDTVNPRILLDKL